MSEMKKKSGGKQPKRAINPIGVITLAAIAVLLMYFVPTAFGVDPTTVLADLLYGGGGEPDISDVPFEPPGQTMRRYKSDQSAEALAGDFRKKFLSLGCKELPAGRIGEPGTKWLSVRIFDGKAVMVCSNGKGGMMRVFAVDEPDGKGCSVVETVMRSMLQIYDGDIPGIAPPPRSKRNYALRSRDDGAFLAFYESELDPQEVMTQMTRSMEMDGWRASQSGEMALFRRNGASCYIQAISGPDGGAFITIIRKEIPQTK